MIKAAERQVRKRFRKFDQQPKILIVTEKLLTGFDAPLLYAMYLDKPMRNKWASCSTNGHLNFNNELLGLDDELWDYVIAHELLHFFVPNHGKLWKSLMKVHLGDYERLESCLKAKSQEKNGR